MLYCVSGAENPGWTEMNSGFRRFMFWWECDGKDGWIERMLRRQCEGQVC